MSSAEETPTARPVPTAPDQVGGPVVVAAGGPGRGPSPVDVLRLVAAAALSVGLLVAQWLFGDTLVAFAADLFAGLAAVPRWLVGAVVAGGRVLAVLVLVAGAVVVARGRSWGALRSAVIAGLGAALLARLSGVFGDADAEGALDASAVPGPLGRSTFPTIAGLAVMAALVTAVAPWMSRRWRRWAWAAIAALATARFLAGPASLDTVGAVAVGWLAGAAVVVAFGGPSRRPGGRAVATGLTEVGIDVVRLEQADVDARGSTPWFGTTAAGDRLFVKVLGDDERAADRLFRLYRRLVPRDLGDERPFTTLRRAVEHEALLALAARDLGVRTPHLVGLSRAEPNGFVLAYEAVEGRSLDRLGPGELGDDVVGAVWEQIVALRAHRIAHRDLRLANIFLGADGEVWMIDFGFSELAAADLLLAGDVAELVASSALAVGPERAVAAAATAVGPEGLAPALARLHPWALSGATRHGLSEQPGLLDDLRSRVAAVAASAAGPAGSRSGVSPPGRPGRHPPPGRPPARR